MDLSEKAKKKETEVSRDDALKVLQNDEQQRRNACAQELQEVVRKHGFSNLEVDQVIKIT